MLASVIEILNYVTLSQLLLFCIFFFFKKQGNSLSNKLLAFLFLVNAIKILTFYLNWYNIDFFLKNAPRLVWSLDFFEFSIGPLLYLYILSLVSNNFKIKIIHFLLFIPFLVFAYLCITRIVIQSPETIKYIVAKDIFLTRNGYLLTYSVLRIMNLTIATLSFIALFKYRRQMRSNNQSLQQFDFRWILTILIGFSLVFIFEAMKYIYYFKENSYLKLTDTIPFIKFIVFNILVFSSIKASALFDANEARIKYSKSQLIDDEKDVLLVRLKEIMIKEKYYLTPSITVQDVAERINAQPRNVSQVINEILGQNFIDFVNSYRIDEAKKMLINPKYKGYSISGILYEAGFNSKTAFNTAFKKQTGYTPKEYRTLNEKTA